MNLPPLQWTQAKTIAGMIPWVCSYKGTDGLTYGLTLHGTDPDQIIEDNCDQLPSLTVEGQLIASAPSQVGE